MVGAQMGTEGAARAGGGRARESRPCGPTGKGPARGAPTCRGCPAAESRRKPSCPEVTRERQGFARQPLQTPRGGERRRKLWAAGAAPSRGDAGSAPGSRPTTRGPSLAQSCGWGTRVPRPCDPRVPGLPPAAVGYGEGTFRNRSTFPLGLTSSSLRSSPGYLELGFPLIRNGPGSGGLSEP